MVWLDHLLPSPNDHDNFDAAVHILFDSKPVVESKDDYWVGVLFHSE